MNLILLTLSLATVIAGESRTTAPSGALVVGGDGSYSTIQDAVDALDTSTSSEQSIFINPGTYNEQVYIQELSGPLSIYGYTSDTTSYSDNEAVISASGSQADGSNDDETATLRIWTSNVKVYNLNVENTYGEGSQALALSASAEVREERSICRRIWKLTRSRTKDIMAVVSLDSKS
jgi:pectinesterase